MAMAQPGAPKSLKLYQADAFSSSSFGGNPAAVVLLAAADDLSESTMLAIAAEMNLSETAFVWPLGAANADADADAGATFATAATFGLRWFTPTREVPLCGHATLATAAVIYKELGNVNPAISFATLSGNLTVEYTAGGLFSMSLPKNAPEPWTDAGNVHNISRLVELAVGDLPVHEVFYSATTKKLLVRLADSVTRAQLEALRPDTAAFVAQHTTDAVRGVMVSVSGASKPGDYDFISRYFAPWVGIPEDPVTGSAHTVLGPYWSAVLGGKTTLRARQCSPRGGDLLVVIEPERVRVDGPATIVLRGELLL